jgi:purine-nucleoside phosphorylase
MSPDSPLFEFDPDPRSVLEPSERFQAGLLPERLVITFFEGALAKALSRQPFRTPISLRTCGLANAPVHVVERKGKPVALFQCLPGAPLAAGFLEELIALGARKVLICGGAGVLDSTIPQGQVLLPTSAVRDEGTSYHYLPAGREVAPGAEALAALEKALIARMVPYTKGKTWTTDGLYRETRGKVAARRAEGCLSVEMEAAAFFAVAQFRGVQCAQLLYGGDDVGGEAWDHRGWSEDLGSQDKLLELCLEAVLDL